ncbi:hypothetical protein ABB37_06078 [Leptomonas pyrrhocoris]|uniref:Transmembrane protein n=1 Tax=Leptomonas pyrrhocoris TaxID=157538 RepID=A0A0N1J4N3_LEPPY|nr:hypothetical protein ABB37_06078 [Leptomonas pyrrhocoris]KPA78451.1 hypothetical protein ABB37_06078 [Leptomonas pyrrhocoris]|eukprot:XP_015656890.1 hypothetical protein ABB37_06078 [Leptomonas pyrrhocoris]
MSLPLKEEFMHSRWCTPNASLRLLFPLLSFSFSFNRLLFVFVSPSLFAADATLCPHTCVGIERIVTRPRKETMLTRERETRGSTPQLMRTVGRVFPLSTYSTPSLYSTSILSVNSTFSSSWATTFSFPISPFFFLLLILPFHGSHQSPTKAPPSFFSFSFFFPLAKYPPYSSSLLSFPDFVLHRLSFFSLLTQFFFFVCLW